MVFEWGFAFRLTYTEGAVTSADGSINDFLFSKAVDFGQGNMICKSRYIW